MKFYVKRIQKLIPPLISDNYSTLQITRLFFTASDEHLCSTSEIFSCEYRVKDSSGKYKWFRTKGQVESRENGKTIINGVMHDITSEKMKEIELPDARAQFNLIAKTPLTGEFLYINRKLCSYLSHIQYHRDAKVKRRLEDIP